MLQIESHHLKILCTQQLCIQHSIGILPKGIALATNCAASPSRVLLPNSTLCEKATVEPYPLVRRFDWGLPQANGA